MTTGFNIVETIAKGQNRMRRKIYRQLTTIAILATVVTMVLITVVFRQLLWQQIIEDLMAGNASKVIAYRKKQVQFRRDLFDEMPACIITKVTEDRILEACHIKPYNACNEDEKYDVANGLVMTPTYHKLFDLGFISFDDKGYLLISPYLSNMNKKRLCIADNVQYMVPKKCAKYLSYHRENIFNKLPDVI